MSSASDGKSDQPDSEPNGETDRDGAEIPGKESNSKRASYLITDIKHYS